MKSEDQSGLSASSVVIFLLMAAPIYLSIVVSLMLLIDKYKFVFMWLGLSSLIGFFMLAGYYINRRHQFILKLGVVIISLSNFLILFCYLIFKK